MRVSFRLMETFRKRGVPKRSGPMLLPDNPGKTQQLRAELQPGSLSAVDVDLEANFVVLGDEVDDSAGLDEPVHLPDGENARALEALHDLGQTLFFRGA